MIPDLDDFGGTFTQGIIRVVLFVVAIFLGGLLGVLADGFAGVIEKLIHPHMLSSSGFSQVISHSVQAAAGCCFSSALPLYLLVLVLVVFEVGFFRCWCLTVTMTVLICLFFAKDRLTWALGLIILGMVLWLVMWLRLWRRNRWAVEMAMLQAENAQRRAELESRGIATFDREPED